MFPTKIVLTTDGSEEARRAAGLAVNLAEGLDSELHLVHVEPEPSVYALPESAIYDPDLGNEVREEAERAARERLEAEVEALGLSGKVAGSHAPVGRPDAGPLPRPGGARRRARRRRGRPARRGGDAGLGH